MTDKPLANFIHNYVRMRSITINDLAKEMDVPHSTVARWAAGKTEPSLKQLSKLANATHTDICYLINLIYPQPPRGVDPDVLRLAESIGKLPVELQKLIDSIILGLSLQSNKQDSNIS